MIHVSKRETEIEVTGNYCPLSNSNIFYYKIIIITAREISCTVLNLIFGIEVFTSTGKKGRVQYLSMIEYKIYIYSEQMCTILL